MKRALLAAAVLASVAACGSGVTSGTVVDRYHSEGYTYFVTTCVAYGTGGSCSVWMPMPIEEPEHYVLTLENCALRKHAEDECPTGRVYVGPDTYADTHIGDHYEEPQK